MGLGGTKKLYPTTPAPPGMSKKADKVRLQISIFRHFGSTFMGNAQIPAGNHPRNPANRPDYASATFLWSNTLLPVCWLRGLGPWCQQHSPF